MNRDTLLANMTAVPGIMAEPFGAYFVRVRLGDIWHDIDARQVVAQPPLVSALWSQQRGDGPAITKPEPVKSTNVTAPPEDFEPEVPDFRAVEDDVEMPLEGNGAPLEPAPIEDMPEELEVPGFLAKRSVTGAVRGHTTTEGW